MHLVAVLCRSFRQCLAHVLMDVTPLSSTSVSGRVVFSEGCSCLPQHCITRIQHLVNTGTVKEEDDDEEEEGG